MLNFKHYIIISILLLLAAFAFSQSKMSYRLQNTIATKSPQEITVLVQFNGNNLASIEQELIGLTLNERSRKVAAFLMQQAVLKQLNLENDAKNLGVEILDYTSLWIANGARIQLKSTAVSKVATLSSIAQLALQQDYAIEFNKPAQVEPASKSINGSEVGLHAIGAPFMWQLGYTGKAKKLLSVDTGVNTDHPAIGEQWLGNYWPIQQSWYAYDSPFPRDKSDSHGTHTTGTILGLEKATNDTIGAAYNAYFFASDPIVQAIVDIKSYDELIKIFQWSLNPDNDTTTADDVPDVINNSWGRSPDGSFDICGTNFFTETFLAVEAAGIANVFSAGNEGPNAQTIGNPANINVGMFNAFSVGAVNGNSTTYPIASFSSRGPSICGGGGSLEIKPEVVAPGQNVRSCVGHSDYGSYSGTSMAAPHVCGAVLLLREAFPTATGQEILSALYQSANDLGPAGEDNTYGNGMISLENTFNLLSQTFAIAAPNNQGVDLKLGAITSNLSGYSCETGGTFDCTVSNIGTNSINSYSVIWGIDTTILGSTLETSALAVGATRQVSITLTNEIVENLNEFWIQVVGNNDIDLINNKRYYRFNKRPTAPLPYFEDFENDNLYFSAWYIENEDMNTSWDTTKTSGLSNGNYSAFMRLSDYLPRGNQKDGLLTPILTMPQSGPIWLTYNYAYQMKTAFFNDSLKIWASTNCGQSWDYLLATYGPEELNTFDTLQNFFVPTRPDMWQSDTVSLSQLAGLGSAMLKFETTNRAGNNLFLDNISIFDQRGPSTIESENSKPNTNVQAFPNPTKNTINVASENISGTGSITIMNVLGEDILKENITFTGQNQFSFSVLDFTSGMYLIQLHCGEFEKTMRFVKE